MVGLRGEAGGKYRDEKHQEGRQTSGSHGRLLRTEWLRVLGPKETHVILQRCISFVGRSLLRRRLDVKSKRGQLSAGGMSMAILSALADFPQETPLQARTARKI